MKKTKIYLLVATVSGIVLVIAVILVPGYKTDQVSLDALVLSDGQASLLHIVSLQEKYYVNHATFANSLQELGYTSFYSFDGYWSLALKESDNISYVIVANTGGINNYIHTDCPQLALANDGTKSPLQCW